MDAVTAELLKDALDGETAKLAAIGEKIEAIKALPAALAEVRLLEEKDTSAVAERDAAAAALVAAEKRVVETRHARIAGEMKLQAAYEFAPNYKDAQAMQTLLADLTARQQQIDAKIKAIANMRGVLEGAAGSVPNAEPPAIVVSTFGGVFLIVRKDIAAKWSWENLPKEILSKYSLEKLHEHSRKRTEGILDKFTEYRYRVKGTTKPGSIDATCDTAFALMDLVCRDQGNMPYDRFPIGYDVVFRYGIHPSMGDDGRIMPISCDTFTINVSLKNHSGWFSGTYGYTCSVVIPTGSAAGHFNIPIWISNVYEARV